MLSRESVLVIGLDGATFDLLFPLIEAGVMPHMQRLIETGISGTLQSTVPPVTAPAWASFQTGTNPGKHGLVDFLRYRPGSYEPALVDARAIQGQTLWRQLSQHGKRICAVNVPLTYPPEPVNGYLVSGFLTPNVDASFTYPVGLREQLLSHVPGYAIAPVLPGDVQTLGVDGFVEGLEDVVEHRVRAAEWLMGQDAWDLFMVHFQATDIIQHALWDRLDPAVPGFAHHARREHDLARRFYRKLDQAIGELVRLSEESTMIVMSDHGFGPALKRVHVNQWLLDHDYLALSGSRMWLQAQAGLVGLAKKLDVFSLWDRILPRDFKRSRGQLIRKLTQAPWIDWAHTRAFVFSGSTFGHLYVNLAGREPSGVVAGSDYEPLRSELIDCFKTMIDPDTGQRVIEDVSRREEVFDGPMLEELPDLIIRPRGGYLLESGFNGVRLFRQLPKHITGLHRMNGICILSGNSFVGRRPLDAAHITDLAPTILHLLGVPVPRAVDGRILSVVEPSSLRRYEEQNVLDEEGTAGDQAADQGYSAEDEIEISERLRDLGYL